MFRVALLSRWHPHGQKTDGRYAKELMKLPGCTVTCVWDKDRNIAKEWGEELNVPYETDLSAVLSRDDVDGVLVTSDPSDHKEILVAAAEHKKHIFTEKVLSFTLEDALLIKEAVKRNGVKFCISFNRLAIPQLAYAKTLLEDGTLGRPVMFRCMCGHRGALNGELPDYWYDPAVTKGGAMIDLGFNSAYLARYILGEFASVGSSFGYSVLNERVEDTASCNVMFKNGAMGLLEATFVSPLLSVFEMALYGTDGSYYARFGGNDTAELRLNGQKSRILPLGELSSPLRSPVETWVKACTEGGSNEAYGIDAAIDMVRFMLAAYASAEADGKRVEV